jgi:hypothetical protein
MLKGSIIWRRPTFPGITQVSSAQLDLTSLFGMVRGVPQRNNHLKIFIRLWRNNFLNDKIWK